MTELAVDGFEVDFVTPPISGDISLTGTPSVKVKAENKGVCKQVYVVNISNYEDSSISSGSGSGPFTNFSQKVLVDNIFVIRKDDIAIVTVTGTNKAAPPPTLAIPVAVKITDAKQTKVLGN
jgi:hypothetical protein